MRIVTTKSLKQNTAVICAVLLLDFTVILSDNVRTAAADAVNSCLTVILPCIFPVTVISFFILETGFPLKIKHITDGLLRFLFGLSGNCLEGVILGLSGGYNTAVKCAVRLRENNAISAEQAKKLSLFFTNPGISFTVLLTGSALSGSIAAGFRLYAETVILNLITAYLYNKTKPNKEIIPVTGYSKGISDAFILAVESASKVIISISFNIIFFSCLTSVIAHLLPNSFINEIIRLISEVSSAVIYSSTKYPFYITAGILTFGGICIFIQNLADLKKLGIKPSDFLKIRLLQSSLVTTAEYILSIIFPESTLTAVIYPVKVSASDNAAGTLSLIFLCAVYLIAVKNLTGKRSATKKV